MAHTFYFWDEHMAEDMSKVKEEGQKASRQFSAQRFL